MSSLEGRQISDVDGNKELFWKEVNGGKGRGCSRIKDGNSRLPMEEDELQRIWKSYFEDLYNIGTKEQVAVYMYGFNNVQRNIYFGELK